MNYASFLKAIASFSALPKTSVKLAKLIAKGLDDGPRKDLYEKLLVSEARMRVLNREEKECAVALESLIHSAKKDIRTIKEESSRESDEGHVRNLESSIQSAK